MIEPVVDRKPRDIEKGVQPDRAFEPNTRNHSLPKNLESTPGSNFTTKKKI